MIDAPPVTNVPSINVGLAIAPKVFKSPGNCPNGIIVEFSDPNPNDKAIGYADQGLCKIYFPPTIFEYTAAFKCTVTLHEWGHAAMNYGHMEKGIMKPVIFRSRKECVEATQ